MQQFTARPRTEGWSRLAAKYQEGVTSAGQPRLRGRSPPLASQGTKPHKRATWEQLPSHQLDKGDAGAGGRAHSSSGRPGEHEHQATNRPSSGRDIPPPPLRNDSPGIAEMPRVTGPAGRPVAVSRAA